MENCLAFVLLILDELSILFHGSGLRKKPLHTQKDILFYETEKLRRSLAAARESGNGNGVLRGLWGRRGGERPARK